MPGDASQVGDAGNVVRQMQAADVTAAAEIIRASPGTAQWPAASIRGSLAEEGFCGWAAEVGGEFAGVLIGRVIGEEFEILNLAVAPDHRRKGIGSALANAALAYASGRGCRSAHLEVRPSNANAIALYLGLGFSETGHRRHYYQNPEEDAVVLMCVLVGKY